VRLLSTLYVVEHGAHVRTTKGALIVITPDGNRTRIPMNTIDSVVLTGYAQMSTDAISECVERGIRVAALRRNGHIRFCVGSAVSGNVLLRLAQYRAADDHEHSLNLARWIVAAKLQNCRRTLTRWCADTSSNIEREVLTTNTSAINDSISALQHAADADIIRGIEGDATRRYFKGFAVHLSNAHEDFRFDRRSRRPPRDPVNALLGFTYALVLTEIVGALDAIGLDPQVGFLHGIRPGRPSLALDLLEEFRSATADKFVARVLRLHQLHPDDFLHTPGGACYLTDNGRRSLLHLWEQHRDESVPHQLLQRPATRASLPHIQATMLARHLRGDLPTYPPFLAT
jgi:CRISP-associated protein Cas1